MAHLLAIDLGTSSVKVALVHAETLALGASASAEYPINTPQPGHAEQEPSAWWEAVVHATRAVLAASEGVDVIGIGLSGQMHGAVLLGAALTPVHPAIIWPDARASAQVAALQAARDTFDATLPGPPAAGFAASSFLWLKENRPDVLDATRVWCLPKDVIAYDLTGNIHTEPSDAASSWLFDVARGAWAEDVAAFCGLSPDQMPEVIPSHAVTGTLTAAAAAELGLPSGVPVVAGSADLPAQGIGCGVVDPATVLITLGTGGQIFVPVTSPPPPPDDRYYLFSHSVADTLYAQAAILSGGLSLRWLRDLLGSDIDYAALSTLAASVPPGADGLLFLPYLAGERSPLMDPDASGAFIGLRLHHGRAHLARAVMEGVAFALRDCLRVVPQNAERFLLSGGGVSSETWTRILADVLGVPLHLTRSDTPHGSIGAAILAAVGVGAISDVTAANDLLATTDGLVEPQPRSVYDERFAQFERLYPLLRDEMHKIRQL